MHGLDEGRVRQLHRAIAALFHGGAERFPARAGEMLTVASGGRLVAAGWRDAKGWHHLTGELPSRATLTAGLMRLEPTDPWCGHAPPERAWLWQLSHRKGLWSAWLLDAPGPVPDAWLRPLHRVLNVAAGLWFDTLHRAPLTPPPEVVQPTGGPDLYAGLEPLTADCLRLAAQSWSNREIAAWLGVSRATVTRRLRRAYDELGAESRRDLPVASLLDRPKPPRHRPPEDAR